MRKYVNAAALLTTMSCRKVSKNVTPLNRSPGIRRTVEVDEITEAIEASNE
jgi:hypothetical protein